MAELDPSARNAPLIFPRPPAGHLRLVRSSHPLTGDLELLTTGADWSDANSPSFTSYAYTPNRGPKQKALHARGTKEVSWRIGGELTTETLPLLNLLASEARGVNFARVLMQQGPNAYQFDNPDGYSLPWSHFAVAGAQDANVTYALEGFSTRLPVPTAPQQGIGTKTLIPGWFAGNDLVTSWSIAHLVPLAPSWGNTAASLPTYYRPGESEFQITLTTAVQIQEHTRVRFGLGEVALIDGFVVHRGRQTGEAASHHSYSVAITNLALRPEEAYASAVTVSLLGGPPA